MRTPIVLLTIIILTSALGPIVLIAGMLGIKERAGGIYQKCMHAWCRGILKVTGVRLRVHHPERT